LARGARHAREPAWDGCRVPSPALSSAGHRERGTASVELIAVVPFLLLAVLAAAQIALAGQALWSAGVAARAAARATLVGDSASAAAKRALPEAMRAGVRVKDDDSGVSVSVPVPRLLPALPRVRVSAATGLRDGDG
jgi:Flp pilus assembly protein TadG